MHIKSHLIQNIILYTQHGNIEDKRLDAQNTATLLGFFNFHWFLLKPTVNSRVKDEIS